MIRIQAAAPAAPADRLIPLNAKGCAAEGFELCGLQALVREGRLPSVKIGRHRYVRYSDMLKLPTAESRAPAPPSPPSQPASGAYATALALANGRRRKAG